MGLFSIPISHISTPFYWSMDDCTIPFERLKWHQKRVYIKQLIERGTHIPEDVQRSVFKAKRKSKPDDQNSVDSGEFLNQPYYAPGPLFGNAAAVQAFHNPFPALGSQNNQVVQQQDLLSSDIQLLAPLGQNPATTATVASTTTAAAPVPPVSGTSVP